MAHESVECVKCGGIMVRGLIVDYSDRFYMPAYWVEGEPVRAQLLGITGTNLDIAGRQKLTIRALRCPRCGYLESYAV